MVLCCDIGIFHKHCYRHRSDPPRNGSYETNGFEIRKISVPEDFSIYYTEPNIDNSYSGMNHFLFQKSWTSSGNDDNIRIFGKLLNIFRLFIAYCNGSSSIHQEERKRFPDDITFPDNNDILTRYLYIFCFQKSHNSFGSAGNDLGSSEKEFPDILTRETVDIFPRINRLDNPIRLDMFWERKLYDEPMDRGIRIYFVDESNEFLFRYVDTELTKFEIDSNHESGSFLLFYIGETCRIFSDQNHRKFWFRREFLDFFFQIEKNSICDGATVDNHGSVFRR